jgi:excisionase family DNA binding protein
MQTSNKTEGLQLLDVEDVEDVEDVAKLLNVRRSAVWQLVRSDSIPHIRLGPRRTRFRADDIEAWIARRDSQRWRAAS